MNDLCQVELEKVKESKKMTKLEQRTIETLTNNFLVKEKTLYCLNEQFVSNITEDILFSTRSLKCFRNKTPRTRLADACEKHRTFL